MRICFFRVASSIQPTTNGLLFQTGLPQSSSTLLSEHQKSYPLTGNRGNMVHRMAMIQSVECDRQRSSQINLGRLQALYKRLGQEDAYAESLLKHYDMVVLTMSNSIRRGPSDSGMLQAIKQLKNDLVVVGLGLQRNLADGLKELSPEMQELLKILNDKARLFGVRGNATLKWLHTNGLTNAKAIGCPSMFAFPKNVCSIRAPKNPSRFLVAGHLGKNYLTAQNTRALGLMSQFAGKDCAYVFQDEIESFEELLEVYGMYDESTSQVNAEKTNAYIEGLSGVRPPFSSYYSFSDVSAWRQLARTFDVYVGDRIHGGVAAMQAGVPALILYADARVAELADYHGIPACSMATFLEKGLDQCMEKYLNQGEIDKFHARYRATLRKYSNSLKQCGLSLAHRMDVREVLEQTGPVKEVAR